MIHQEFITTQRGLNRQLPAMRLYEKAKRFGIWNPSDDSLWPVVEDTMNSLLPDALAVVGEAFDRAAPRPLSIW